MCLFPPSVIVNVHVIICVRSGSSWCSNSDLANPLSRATISCRVSWKPLDGLFSGRFLISFSENRILRAVPRPWVWRDSSGSFSSHIKTLQSQIKCCYFTCNVPQSRHLLQPTQSMIREMFLKWSLNSSWTKTTSKQHLWKIKIKLFL